MNGKQTILYARLSQDDGSQGDSNSIQNQRLILEKYATDNGFENTIFLSDDGYSGTNFERPSFIQMMTLIENGEVATVIVKDLSRLGRNYLEVGRFTEIVFPGYDVRFIAINDGVDSKFESSNDFTPMRNWVNELTAKDTSKKIKASKKAKAGTGAYVGTMPPYGYKKDPLHPKSHLVIDEVAAHVVERIFSLCMAGIGVREIAKILTADKIPTPSEHYYRQKGVALSRYNPNEPYLWRHHTISAILEKEVYIGNMVSLQTTTKSFKDKTQVAIPPEQHFRFEGTHEAIIDRATWEIVQEIRSNKRRNNKVDEKNIFAGIVVCKNCGSTLTLSRSTYMKRSEYVFVCSKYRKQGKEACSGHRINMEALEEIVLNDIKRITCFARAHTQEFAAVISRQRSADTHRKIKKSQNTLEKLHQRKTKLATLFKRLYEDYVLGEMPKETYRALSEDYLSEQTEVQSEIDSLVCKLEQMQSEVNNTARFLEKAKKYTEISTLTAELLHVFIEKIVIYERTIKWGHNQEQQIDIYYRDIGLLDMVTEQDVIKALKLA